MKKVDYYKKAITQALNTRDSIEKANADYEHNCELAKNAYEADKRGLEGTGKHL